APLPRQPRAPRRGPPHGGAPRLPRARRRGRRPRPGRGDEAAHPLRRNAAGARGHWCQPRRPRRRPPALARGAAPMSGFAGVLGALPLPWPFDREYMQLALVAGLVIGVCAPLIGVFLVQQRLSLMGDGIGHLAFAGVAAGLLLEVWPLWTALLVAVAGALATRGVPRWWPCLLVPVAGALAIEWLRSRGRTTSDLALALWFYGGIAAGIVLASRAGSGGLAIVPYLFGSILTINHADVRVIVLLGLGILATLAIFGRALFAIVVDEESARVNGIPVGLGNAVLAVLTAVTVVAAMRVVGVLLVAALMVLPVASGRILARSYRGTLTISSAIGAVSVVLGLAAARRWALAPGGTIVLVAAGLFAIPNVAGRPARAPTPAHPHLDPHALHDHEHWAHRAAAVRRSRSPWGAGPPAVGQRGGSRGVGA